MKEARDVIYYVGVNKWEIGESYLARAINFHVACSYDPGGSPRYYRTSVWADTKEEALQKGVEKIQPFIMTVSIEKPPTRKEAQHILKKQQSRQLIIFKRHGE